MTREEILKHVEEEEFKQRCFAVNICPYCGGKRRNIAKHNPYNPVRHVICMNGDCDGKE